MPEYQRRGPARTPPRQGPSPARRLALEALLDVSQSGSYSGLALDKRIKAGRLSVPDRRLATELFYGVLETRLRLDYILSLFMQRPQNDSVVREILRLGVYQLVCMDKIPASAACDESVELARAFKREALCPLVNGVLRAVVRGKADIKYPTEPLRRLSVVYSFPQWLVEKLLEHFDAQTVEKLLSYRPEEKFSCIRPNRLKIDPKGFEDWLTHHGFAWERGVTGNAYRVSGGGLAQHVGFRSGLYSIMGEASMMAAQALGVRPGMQVLDACAAPGGKACYLAEMMGGSGRVHAWDVHEHRTRLISGYASRLGLDNVRVRIQDASAQLSSFVDAMDAVLVDAPCSGLGVSLNKPDIKYRLQPENLKQLAQTQSAILDCCAAYVKEGGALLYSTCTLLPEENEQVVAGFLARHPQFEPEGLAERLPAGLAGRVQGGMVTLYPYLDGTDGFFMARMVRRRLNR